MPTSIRRILAPGRAGWSAKAPPLKEPPSAATRFPDVTGHGDFTEHDAVALGVGGLWMPALGESSVTKDDMTALGADTLQVVIDALDGCVTAGQATSTDLYGDAVALWLGLHGLAGDIADRIITTLAHLKDA
ncbi:TetR-like C-terminal domain-containing protein [Streptomyces sp. NPDC059396]|uniref:TetR-like C-terminal domain-containing protein n=1 Tax=Streptomyces sp. NPDC059396 TaxID=3346819 RepID=UPI0036ADE6C2